MKKCEECGVFHHPNEAGGEYTYKDRNKSRHRPGYFTEYMRKYRERKAQERLNPSQAKLK